MCLLSFLKLFRQFVKTQKSKVNLRTCEPWSKSVTREKVGDPNEVSAARKDD